MLLVFVFYFFWFLYALSEWLGVFFWFLVV